jgi:hypothetical protein
MLLWNWGAVGRWVCLACQLLLLESMSTAGLQVVLLLVFGSPSRSLYASLLCLMAFMLFKGACSFDFRLIQGVCSYICTRESVPFILCSASLPCFWFGQRTLFLFSLYCWTPAPFWSIIFLHLIKKKKVMNLVCIS